ncbi:Spore wall protein 7 [Nosema granulosis]|uniref:Spore wall protein 7 n=1 Tax=Nosema granulosis TaxID=83296 RepID=A0A9P6GX95_9MICR|nr:Spore wall protein 7 [Nosema granulosis]
MISVLIFLLGCYCYVDVEHSDSSTDINSYGANQYEEEYGKFPAHVLSEKDPKPKDLNRRCTTDNFTYIINLNVHLQKYAAESIEDAAKSKLGMNLKQRDAILSYFGTIANELNADLARLGVQVVIQLKRYKAEDFIDTNSFDTSCEIKDAVTDRLDSSFNQLKDVFQDSIGLQLFVWTCPQVNSSFLTLKINKNEDCGRVIGVLWQGIDPTSTSIKSGVLEAITGIPDLYLDGSLPVDRVFSNVCRYSGKCVGVEPGVIGWKQFDVLKLIHAIPDDTHEHA